ncbi:MAG: hypothetical protein WC479_03020 [Candidatus Izemoplasmatales bacterium]
MIIKISHPELDLNITRLSADVAVSATSATVENNEDLTTNDYVVWGRYGEEKSEIVLLTSVTGNTTIGHTTGPVFAHAANTQVSKIPYNQIQIYRSTSETGTYTLIATTDITPDEVETTYNDTDGTTSSWYKTRFYNVAGTTYSDYSDVLEGTGYEEDSLRSITDEVLEDFGDENSDEINRSMVARVARAAVRKITVALIRVKPDYRQQYTTQDLTSGTATYSLPTRFLTFLRVDLNLTGTSATEAYKATFESERHGEPDTSYYTNNPRVFFRDGVWGIRPTPAASGRAFLWYWDYPAEMTDDTDTHGLPYGARDLIVSYCLYRLWASKDIDKSNVYKAEFRDGLTDWLELTGQARQVATNRGIEVILGSDLYSFDDE